MVSKKKIIIVTGGAGYIGSHVVYELLQAGFKVGVIDDLSNGSADNLFEKVEFYQGDFADQKLWDKIGKDFKVEAVMHLAASIDGMESLRKPMVYLENNTLKTSALLKILEKAYIDKLIFSSTAAVYGRQIILPISENASLHPVNPYGQSKLLSEDLISYYSRNSKLNSVILRYFNASGTIDDVSVKPKNTTSLIAKIKSVLNGTEPKLKIYGDDFDTRDGTCVRDLVHVIDIARAHVAALDYLKKQKRSEIFNVGSGNGFTVTEIIEAAEAITGKNIKKMVVKRRADEIPVSIADNSLIQKKLQFKLLNSDLKLILGSIL